MNVADVVAELHGTSPDKIAQLMQRLRSNPRGSAVLWALEKMPFGIGDTVRFALYELPDADAVELDGYIAQLADSILSLRSDRQELATGDPE